MEVVIWTDEVDVGAVVELFLDDMDEMRAIDVAVLRVVALDEVGVKETSEVANEVGDDVGEGQTHPTSAKLVMGGTVQVACASHGSTEVTGAVPATVSIFTRTGITAPVLKLKVR